MMVYGSKTTRVGCCCIIDAFVGNLQPTSMVFKWFGGLCTAPAAFAPASFRWPTFDSVSKVIVPESVLLEVASRFFRVWRVEWTVGNLSSTLTYE
jgi:hypothetical protein